MSTHETLPALPAFPASGLPVESVAPLPERVLQFGTGVLLRGLPDYLIDKANQQGIFNGRIVVIKSTNGGDLAPFARQNNEYTLCIRGLENNQIVEENVRCAAISRVLAADQAWPEILRIAANPDLQLVLSNTTEVGIQLVQEPIDQTPPVSFPAKLLAILYARYRAFTGDLAKGLLIVPTELIPENGKTLQRIVRQLAVYNNLETPFMDWLDWANTYCNSLVDRIVPGSPDPVMRQTLLNQLGYQDDLLILAESFKLWAIEGDDRVRSVLSFAQVDNGIVIQPDINLFRELKLRLLNGTHTLSCGVAYLSGINTVRQAMDHSVMSAYINQLMTSEIIPGIPYPVDTKTAEQFSRQVQDRFRNPYIEHRWLSITAQYTAKMRLRNVPTLMHYYRQQTNPPLGMALGFAAFLLFMRGITQKDGVWYGYRGEEPYAVQDAQADYFASVWATLPPQQLTTTVLANTSLWGQDLSLLPNFSSAVATYLQGLLDQGILSTLKTYTNPAFSVAG